jgi:Meiotically up-regulated gene 113
MAEKQQILNEIQRLATANGGKAPGRQTFERETGIRLHDWYPHTWLRWSEALLEAGYAPNQMQMATPDEVLIQKFIELVRELKRVPVDGEYRRKARSDKSFPGHQAWRRFGGKRALLKMVARYCKGNPGYEDVTSILDAHASAVERGSDVVKKSGRTIATGFVYLMKSGRHYKIGRTNAVGRRTRELTIEIPVPPKTVHSIETDDPVGVESYWHNRFRDKRGAGEWFELTPDDVVAFKRWRRIV